MFVAPHIAANATLVLAVAPDDRRLRFPSFHNERQLLTHTAGFGYNFDSAVARDFKPRHGDTFTEVLSPLYSTP